MGFCSAFLSWLSWGHGLCGSRYDSSRPALGDALCSQRQGSASARALTAGARLRSFRAAVRRDPLLKHALIAFACALGLYLVAFHGIEFARQAKGPWQVTFRSDANGAPSLIVSQPQKQISDVTLVFRGERLAKTNLLETVVFDGPKTNVPFGRVIFFDTTFLPGTITLDLFGHEIELLPRVLGVNRREVPWKSGAVIELSQEEKPPPRADRRKRQ